MRTWWLAPALAALLPVGAAALPMLGTEAAFVGTPPSTDADGPQAGGSLASSVTTGHAALVCQFTGTCTGDGTARAAQSDTPSGTRAAVLADGVFFDDPDNAETLTARTVWENSPLVNGPARSPSTSSPGGSPWRTSPDSRTRTTRPSRRASASS
jgi:hypothetical protein